MPLLSIITVGMNHRVFIQALYDSLFVTCIPKLDFEAIYVDNCSTDDSVGFIREKYPQVKVIVNSEKLGFGENNNKGVLASTGDYIGIMNPDIILKEGSIDKVIEKAQEMSGRGVFAPQLLNPDGSVQYSVRKFATLKMMLQRWMSWENDNSNNSGVREYLCKDIDNCKTQKVDWAMGAALFMSRDVYAQLGGFDQRYFLYMEDEDLCLRAWQQGIPVIYYPESQMTHNHLKGSRKLGKKTFYHLKSLFTFFRRHGFNAKRIDNYREES